jgi:hypothetical protein
LREQLRSCANSICSIPHRLFSALSRFAEGTRYHNLDSLSEAGGSVDPLEEWGQLFAQIIDEDVPKKIVKRLESMSVLMSHYLEKRVFVVASGLDKRSLTLKDLIYEPSVHDVASKYAVYHLFTIIAPLRELLTCTSGAVRRLDVDAAPYMGDFLRWAFIDKPYILSKKRWP